MARDVLQPGGRIDVRIVALNGQEPGRLRHAANPKLTLSVLVTLLGTA